MPDRFAGRYRLSTLLGSGAQGLAIRVEDTLTGHPAVLKLGLSGRESHDGTLAEFEALRGLTTPYTAPVVELGFASSVEIERLTRSFTPSPTLAPTSLPRPYLVRAWIDGPTILDWARSLHQSQEGEAAITAICRVLAHLTEAIADLHRGDLIHSDLKPEHVLIVTAQGAPRPSLIDFGMAITQGGGLQGGTPAYMAPERLRGAPASQAADRFSLGLIMAQALLGERTELSQIGQPSPRWNALPARIRQTILRLLDAHPDHRPNLESVFTALLPPTDAVHGWRPPARRRLPFLGLTRLSTRDALATRAAQGDAPPVILFVGARGSGRSRMLRQTGWSLQSRGRSALELLPGRDPWARLLMLGPRLASLAGASYTAPVPESFVGDRAGWIQRLARSLSEVAPRHTTEILWDDIGASPMEGLDPVEALALAIEQAQGALRLWATTTPDRLGPLRTLFASAGFEVVPLEPLTPDDLHGLHGRNIGGRHLSYGELQRLHAQSQGLPGRLARLLEPPTSRSAPEPPSNGPDVWLQALASLLPGGITQPELERAADHVGLTANELEGALERAISRGDVAAAAHLERPGVATWTAHTPAWEHLHARERLGRALTLFAPRHPHLAILAAALRQDRDALERAWDEHSRRLQAQQASALVMTVLEPALTVAPSPNMLEAYTEAALETGSFERGESHLQRCVDSFGAPWPARIAIARARLAFAAGDLSAAEAHVAPPDLSDLEERERAQAALLQAQIDMRRGRYRQSHERATAAASRLEQRGATHPTHALRADLLVTAAAAASFMGQDGHGALEAAREALEHLQVPARIEARYHGLKAVAAYMRGALEEATEDYRAALEVVEQAGLAADRPLYLLNLGTAYERQVRLSLAREYYEQGARACLPTTRASTRALLLANRANVDVKLGRAAEARELLAAARRIAQEASLDSVLRFIRHLEADSQAAEGHLSAAEHVYAELAQQYEVGGDLRHACELALEAGLAAVRSSREAAARQYLSDAEALADDFPDLKPTVNILRAELDLTKGGIERLSGMDRYLRALESALDAGDDLTVLEQARWLRRRLQSASERSDPLALQELAALTHRAWRRVALSLSPELRDDLARHLELPPESAPGHGASGLTYVSNRLTAPGGHIGGVPLTVSSRDAITQKFYRMISLNRRILGETDLERLIPAALDIALDLSGAERGFLLLREDDAHPFEVAFSRDIDGQPISEAHLEISQTVALEVATSGRAVVTTDAAQDQRFEQAVSVVHFQLTSILCVPICSRDQILGCLYLDHRSQPGVFTGEAPTMLAAYADQVAIALVSARRVGELRHERDELARAQARIEALLKEKESLLMDLETRCESLEADLARERSASRLRYDYTRIIAEAPTMRRVLEQVDRVVATDLPVVVQGESGTGKELISRAIHFNGPRGEGPFVAVNCGALTESLLESELFGHKKGAFTGAISERKGLFETASGGTLFLDEVGEMSLVMQVKLLRALQEQRVRPVGATREVEVDVRILAATNRDLASMVEEGTFRQDLYYRLATLVIRLPPLRQRAADIPLLVRHILRDACARLGAEPPIVTGGAVEALMGYTWPGNIRQLENVIRAALALRDGDITADVVRPLIQAQGPAPRPIATAPAPVTTGSTVQVGRPPKCGPKEVRAALEGAGYNRSQAAEELGVSLRTLQRYIKKYRLG